MEEGGVKDTVGNADDKPELMYCTAVIIITTANITQIVSLLLCLLQDVSDSCALVVGASSGGHKQQTEQYKEKHGILDNKSPTPVDLPELEVDRSACWRSISLLLSAWPLIVGRLRIDTAACRQGQIGWCRWNTRAAPTLSLLLGPNRAQMGGRTGDIEL